MIKQYQHDEQHGYSSEHMQKTDKQQLAQDMHHVLHDAEELPRHHTHGGWDAR